MLSEAETSGLQALKTALILGDLHGLETPPFHGTVDLFCCLSSLFQLTHA